MMAAAASVCDFLHAYCARAGAATSANVGASSPASARALNPTLAATQNQLR